MQLQYFEQKMSFYLFIAISFYRNIACKNIVCDVGLNAIKKDITIFDKYKN